MTTMNERTNYSVSDRNSVGPLQRAVVAVCLLVSALPTHAQEPPTLEELRAGLESAWSQIQNRSVRFVQSASNVPAREASATHPDRVEFEVIHSSDGKLLTKQTKVRNGQAHDTYVTGWDGTKAVSVNDSRASPDTANRAFDAVVQAAHGVETSELSILALNYSKPYHELLTYPGARVIGPVDVDGNQCWQMAVVTPAGFNGFPHDRVFYFDIDPAKSFWPRKVTMHKVGDSDDKQYGYQVLEFQKAGSLWYPRVAKLTDIRGSSTFQFITSVELNRSLPVSSFQPEIPVGASVSDRINGTMYIQGGEEGRRARQDQLASAMKPLSGERDVSAIRNSWPGAWLLSAIGIGLVLVAAALWLRQRNASNQPNQP